MSSFDPIDSYSESSIAQKATFASGKITKITMILIVALVFVIIGSAALTIPKVVENNKQAEEVEKIQQEIHDRTKNLKY